MVCFIHVFDQTLAEQLYRDKGLLDGTLELLGALESMGETRPSRETELREIYNICGGHAQKQRLLQFSSESRKLPLALLSNKCNGLFYVLCAV